MKLSVWINMLLLLFILPQARGAETTAPVPPTPAAPAVAVTPAPAAPGTAGVPRVVQYEENLKGDVQQEKELRQRMIDMIAEMVTVMKDYDASSQSMSGISGLGRVEQLQFKAERYSAERQVRKRIEKDIQSLSEVAQEWQATQDRVKEWTRLLEMERRIQAMKNSVTEEKAVKGNTAQEIENVEYYTLKVAGTFKQVSALADVYGNENAWRYLYDANRDKVTHSNAIIPAGTTLTVPSIKNKNKFVNLD